MIFDKVQLVQTVQSLCTRIQWRVHMLWDRDPEVKSLNSVQISVVIIFVEYFFKTCLQSPLSGHLGEHILTGNG